MADCETGVFVDGACKRDGGFQIPKIGGQGSYYTSFSCVFLIVGALLLFGVFLPIMAAAPHTLGNSVGVNYGLLPLILASCANSVGVFFGSQTMQATGYKLWDSEVQDGKQVTLTSDLLDKMLKGNFLVHTLPMVGALFMLGALVGMSGWSKSSKSSGNKPIIFGVAMLWIILLAGIYLALPVSRKTSAFGQPIMKTHLPEERVESDMIQGEEKFKVVYNHPRPWMAMMSGFSMSLLTALGITSLLR